MGWRHSRVRDSLKCPCFRLRPYLPSSVTWNPESEASLVVFCQQISHISCKKIDGKKKSAIRGLELRHRELESLSRVSSLLHL